MKKIITRILLIFSLFWLIWVSFMNTSYWISVIVTESIPGADCWKPTIKPDKKWKEISRTYKCTVKKWFSSVVSMMWAMIKYFTFLAWLGWVLYLVINGIMYSMWGMDQWIKDESKKRISKTLVWLVLLFLSGVILNIIAPWIYK